MISGSKKYGDDWVFSPIACVTGALHAQPGGKAVRIEACGAFTPDYTGYLDLRGALDAPDNIPTGGVRALDFVASKTRLLIAHEWRAGCFA